jgi:hypothetical protein
MSCQCHADHAEHADWESQLQWHAIGMDLAKSKNQKLKRPTDRQIGFTIRLAHAEI